ncbi:MAG TPA: hypothetical protein DD412_00165, partial [Holosporales bacterium]|nr:hypothetical protein [Holosporales bacterium]
MNDYAYKLLITRHIWGFDHKKTYSNQTEATQSFFNSIYGLRPDLKLPFLLGENEQGKLEYTDLKKHHTLIGGATEGGKTTYIKGGLINLLHWSSPEYLKVGVIDLKRAGFRASENIVTFGDTHEKATEIIKKLHGIMEKRNLLLGDLGCENSCEANAIAYRTRNTKYMMPYIVFIFDEFADYLEKESKNKRDD